MMWGILGLVVLVLISLICREIVCWVFKFNAMERELAAIGVVVVDQATVQEVSQSTLYETNLLLSRIAGVQPPVRPA